MITDLDVAKKLAQIAESARSRGIYFNMSLVKIRRLLKQKTCYYTGETLTDEDGDLKRTFDRLDNNKGYTDDNVVVCANFINSKKGNLTVDEIKLIYKGLVKKKIL